MGRYSIDQGLGYPPSLRGHVARPKGINPQEWCELIRTRSYYPTTGSKLGDEPALVDWLQHHQLLSCPLPRGTRPRVTPQFKQTVVTVWRIPHGAGLDRLFAGRDRLN